MPATDCQAPLGNLGRSIPSLGRDQQQQQQQQVHSMETLEIDLESFQKQVANRFHSLSSAPPDEFLSLDWVRKLLDAFLCCHVEFRAILFRSRPGIAKPPLDRHVSEFFDRSVKALDVCNAIRDGVEQIRQWQKLLEIVLCALDSQKSVGEGQVRRARKALVDLAIAMLDDKDSSSAACSGAHRNRSFGRNNNSAGKDHKNSLRHFRSLSWSVSRSWSAAKQVQAIGNNLIAPKSNEIVATSGLATAVFTMSSVLLFVMCALVAAIPCQDRGLQTHFSVPRQFAWAGPIMALHERILEESRKRDRKNAAGLLKEIHQIEKCARHVNELADSIQFPLTEEKEGELKRATQEVAQICEAIKKGLNPLERQVREVFHRIVKSRTEGLDSLGRASHEN